MRKPKILFVASIAEHFESFHLPYLKWFQEHGYETHTAACDKMDLPYIDKQWQIDIHRSPVSLQNRHAYRQLKKLIDRENYVLISCHTPVASILTRLAAKEARRKRGTKVIYTAHGFHFYKGSSIFNWITYYPIEIYMSRYADAVVTINTEDYNLISKKGFRQTDYYLIPGIGVNKRNFYPISSEEKMKLRIEKGFPVAKKILVYGAEFIPRKNHQFIIEAVDAYRNKFQNIVILFAGHGALQQKLRQEVKKRNLENIFQFIGYRPDISDIYKLSDLGISTSKQEGLGINLVEEMMCGLPAVAAEDRGHREVVDSNINGFIFPQGDKKAFVGAVQKIIDNPIEYQLFSENALKKSKKFELQQSLNAMAAIFEKYLNIQPKQQPKEVVSDGNQQIIAHP